MSEIARVALFGKLNPLAYKAIESATVFCKMRGNPYVELVHWVAQLVQTPQSDIEAILREVPDREAGRLYIIFWQAALNAQRAAEGAGEAADVEQVGSGGEQIEAYDLLAVDALERGFRFVTAHAAGSDFVLAEGMFDQ